MTDTCSGNDRMHPWLYTPLSSLDPRTKLAAWHLFCIICKNYKRINLSRLAAEKLWDADIAEAVEDVQEVQLEELAAA